jgi:hypothetical protein
MRHTETGQIFNIDMAREFLQKYCDCGLCVTLTPTEYIYTKGGEPGFVVGLINYPRFPMKQEVLKAHAIHIAIGLKEKFKQARVSIVLPNETLMLEEE